MAGSVTTAMPSSSKQEYPEALHNFLASGGNAFKCALIASALAGNVAYGAATTNYGAGSGTPTQANLGTDEASGTNYSAGGVALTNQNPALTTTQAYWQFASNPTYTNVTVSVAGCMIYNTTSSNRAVYVGSFGGTQSITGGTLTLQQPSNAAGSALLQLN